MIALMSLVIFYIGAGLGSFLSVIISRVHNNESGIILGRSHCAKCKQPLVSIDLIPIASYLMLKGKCRYCKEKISPHYPMIEFLTGIVLAALYGKFPFIDLSSLSPSVSIEWTYAIEFIRYASVSFVLIAIFFYDLLYEEIPDIFTYFGIAIALLSNIVTGTPGPTLYIPGAAIGALFFEAQLLISRGKWIGSGDVTLGLLMGILLGWKSLLIALFIAYLAGSMISLFLLVFKKVDRKTKIPFAPFLVTGTIVALLFGEEIIGWYLGALIV